MRRIAAVGIAVVLVLFSFAACGKKAGAPVAGSATGEDMLSLFPKEASGFMVVDIHRAMQTEPAAKLIANKEAAPKYQQFIKETGIDPQKDIYFVAGALMGDMQQGKPDGAVVINARYNKDTLLAKLKESGAEYKESVYEGLTLYEIKEAPKKAEASPAEAKPEGQTEPKEHEKTEPPAEPAAPAEKPGYGAFLDASNIALGSEAGVKAVIDVFKNKKENIFKNPDMAGLIKQAKKDSMFWAVMNIPADASKKLAESNPMLSSLVGIHSLLLAFDYKNKAIDAEIKALGKDEQKNKQIADLLTGLKAAGAMAGNAKPALAELVNKIIISSGADFVSVTANIPEELFNRLGEEAKKAIPQMEKPKEENKEPQSE